MKYPAPYKVVSFPTHYNCQQFWELEFDEFQLSFLLGKWLENKKGDKNVNTKKNTTSIYHMAAITEYFHILVI